MNYAGIIKNDFAAAPGVCVSFFVQGCPIHCPGCHNPEAQNFKGGYEFTPEVLENIIKALTANGIKRNLCIMGGEPMCAENQFLTLMIINEVKQKLPNTKIYLWTGYYLDDLLETGNKRVYQILSQCDQIIDGPFEEDKRDITLFMRGSSNQRIISVKDIEWNGLDKL